MSSRRLRQEFPDLARHNWQANRLRREAYFAGATGEAHPIPVLRQYIEQQDRPPDRLTSVRLHHRPEGRRTSGEPGSNPEQRHARGRPEPGSVYVWLRFAVGDWERYSPFH